MAPGIDVGVGYSAKERLAPNTVATVLPVVSGSTGSSDTGLTRVAKLDFRERERESCRPLPP